MSSKDTSAKVQSDIKSDLKQWISFKYELALKELSMSDPFLQVHSLMTIQILKDLDRAFDLNHIAYKPQFSKIIYDLIPEYRHYYSILRKDFTPIPEIQKTLLNKTSTKEARK